MGAALVLTKLIYVNLVRGEIEIVFKNQHALSKYLSDRVMFLEYKSLTCGHMFPAAG